MRNMTIEYYSENDCPKATPKEQEALERELEWLLDGIELFSDAGAGKKVSAYKLKRILRKSRLKQTRNF